MIGRRDLIKSAAVATLFANAPVFAKRRAAAPLGLQLFTVMKPLEEDFDGTLALVSALGYKEVETLGSFGRDPHHVRDALAKHGLTTPSQHLMPGDLYSYFRVPPRNPEEKEALSRRFSETFAPSRVDTFMLEAIQRAKALGQRYVIWQLGWRPHYTLADATTYAKAFNRAGQLCADAGLEFAYHNHDLEFKVIDGRRPFDILVGETDPKLVKLEIDFMWASIGGANIPALLRSQPNRFRLCHLKDRSAANEIVTTGTGVENFPMLIAAAKAAGIQHFYFEFDRPVDPIAEARTAAAFLKPILAR